MQFNSNDYETVKERKSRFYADNKDGRIIVKNITPLDQLLEFALFEVSIFRNKEDQEKNLVLSTGYAMEIRDKELSKNKYGKEYESVNYASWTENCEESAIGRALDNAGYSGNKKCSLEEMNKAQTMVDTIKKTNTITQKNDELRNEFEKSLQAGEETNYPILGDEPPVALPNDQETCSYCGAKKVLNPKTGKMFCEKKCWLNK